jgi:hypothetical protein
LRGKPLFFTKYLQSICKKMDFNDLQNLTEAYNQVNQQLDEAEGSYGETPKAYAAASKTKMTAKRKPFLKKMLRRTNPAERRPETSPRKGMTASDREEARAGAAHGSPRGHDYPSEGPGGITKNPKKLRKQKAMGEFAKEDFELWVESLVEEGYDLSEYTWDDMLDIYEAEGSYGKTPKARQAMGKLAIARREKPASEYSQKGEKTKKVKAIEKHTQRIDNGPDAGNRGKKSTKPRWSGMLGKSGRGKLDQDSRDYARDSAVEYTAGGHKPGPGTVTKNPKKLRKQKAMGEIDESYNTYQVVLSHLLEEGYASNEESADKIILNMSESWFAEIIEARRMDTEGSDRGDSARAERAEKAKSSFMAAKKGKETRLKAGITNLQHKAEKEHSKNFPGSRQEPKVKGEKESPEEEQRRKATRHNERVMKHGFTEKEKKESKAREKYDSARD